MRLFVYFIFQLRIKRLAEPYGNCLTLKERNASRNAYQLLFPVAYRPTVGICIVQTNTSTHTSTSVRHPRSGFKSHSYLHLWDISPGSSPLGHMYPVWRALRLNKPPTHSLTHPLIHPLIHLPTYIYILRKWLSCSALTMIVCWMVTFYGVMTKRVNYRPPPARETRKA